MQRKLPVCANFLLALEPHGGDAKWPRWVLHINPDGFTSQLRKLEFREVFIMDYMHTCLIFALERDIVFIISRCKQPSLCGAGVGAGRGGVGRHCLYITRLFVLQTSMKR